MIRRLSKTSLWCLGILLAASLLAFGLLAYTERGLQWAVAALPERLGQSRMRIVDVRGTLAGGLTVREFWLEHPRVKIEARGIKGRVAMLPLLWQTIEARDGVIDFAKVSVFPRVGPPRKPRFLPPFLVIRGAGAVVKNATLIATNGRRFDATEVVASGSVRSKVIKFYDAQLRMQDLRGGGQLEIRAADVTGLSGQTRWTFAPAGQPVWTATADVDGDLAELGITGEFTAPLRARFDGAAEKLNASDWFWSGMGRIDALDLRAWGAGGLLGKITGQLNLRGDRRGFIASGPLQSAGLAVGDIDALLVGNYADKVISAERLELVHRASKSRVSGRGKIGIEAGGPRLDLSGSWQDFRWPLVGASPSVRSTAGRYRLQGIWPYALEAEGPLQVAEFAPMPTRVQGELARDQLRIARGAVDLLGGKAEFSGAALWSPQERWQFSGTTRDLDTAQLRSGFPGRIGFKFSAEGDGYGGAEPLRASFTDLAGRVRGAAARGSGAVERRGDDWSFTAIKLAAGGLQLNLDGDYGPRRHDLKFNINAADLAILAAGSRGRLKASGVWTANETDAWLNLQASGSDLHHDGVSIGELSADVELDPRPGRKPRMDVRARNIGFLGRVANRAQLQLDGSFAANAARFEMQLGETTVRSTADGAIAKGVWRGRWRELRIDDRAQLHLKLAQPTQIAVGFAGIDVEKFCLLGTNARVCPSLRLDEAGWRFGADAGNLPLAALTTGLTRSVIYDGTIDGNVQLSASAAGPVVGDIKAELRDAKIRRLRSRNREDVLALGTGEFSAVAERDTLRSSLKLSAGAVGFIDGSLTAQRRNSETSAELPWQQWPLRAALRVESNTLSFVSIALPEIDRLTGTLKADMQITGTLGAPRAGGAVQLAGGELDFYQVNLALRQLNAQATLVDNRVEFSSAGRAGDGSLAANGALRWERGELFGNIDVRGDNLLAVNVPEAKITASPNLQFKFAGRDIDVSGEVKLPYARIAPADLAGAVLTSSDEVLADAPVVEPAARTRVSTNIRLTLGDQVSIDTFGLSGRLAGSIQTRSGLDGTTRATGELNVTEGKYAALGRRLDIQRGRLGFTGGLLGDPTIDIRATKQYPEVVAGVNVRGTLRAPRMTFFAEPSLPQSQIVSLILAGGSIETAQNSQRAGAGRAELLAQGGAILAQQLGARVGVDDVGIEQNLDNETSLVLGKYLSPRLYVSYGISLAESINTIKMRYALDDRWTLRTEAGKERSAEIVYSFEK